MYEVFYNLKAEPFRLSPDHRFCFEHKGYAKARAYMAYAFKRAEGFVMITGRPGTGKTTLIGELVESLSRDKVFTANLVCTQLSADDLLKTVAYSFGIGSGKLDKAELLQRLTVLFHRWHREGRRALLIVDEAQDLSSSAMEELRLLTNIQIGGQPLLQIFLLGQPELRDLILSPAMEQVHQRIVAASHIDGLEADETEAYVIHRLLAVGWHGDPAIDRAIFPLIHKYSEGVPRRINLICSRLFLLGSVEQRHAIEVEDVCVVIGELQAENLAAGTGFSQGDFVVNGQADWVPVPVVTSVRPEPHLHAVDNQPFVPADEDLADSEDGGKKKEISEVAAIVRPVPAGDYIDTGSSEIQLYGDQGADQVSEGRYENEAEIFDPQWIEPEHGERILTSGPARVIEPHSNGKRGIYLILSLLVVVVSLTLSLRAYFSHRENRTTPQPASQPRTNLGDGHSSVSENPTYAPAGLSTTPSSAPLESPSSIPVTGLSASAAVPIVAEIAVPQEITGDETLIQSHGDAQSSNLTAPTSVNPASNFDGRPLSSTTTVAEDFEQTFLVSFAFDSDDLLADSHQTLDSALERLREQPKSLASITGFTDSQGTDNYNLALSRKRADAVEQYLVDAGIDGRRLHVEGRGVQTAPVEDQLTGAEIDMELHRVVQIKLSDDESQ